MNKMLVAVFSNEELKADYTVRNEKFKQAGKLISEAFTLKEERLLIISSIKLRPSHDSGILGGWNGMVAGAFDKLQALQML